MLHLNLLVGMNNPRKSCREVQRINIQEGSQLSWFFFHENFVNNKIALDLLIKWTSHIFIKEKWRKVGSPRQYWFLTLSNMISWYFSSLWIIWDAAFYLMSKKINLKVETREKRWRLCIIPLHFIKSRFQHCWMLNIEFWRIFLEISCIVVAVALTDVCVDEKGRFNVQNEYEHCFASYFILLNAQEQKFDDKFLS